MSKPILGYWDIRGSAEPLRLMLEYKSIDYEYKRYPVIDSSGTKAWFKEKFSLGLDFPNLPYFLDGEIKISEAFAILRHIGLKCGLSPKTYLEITKCNEIECVVTDLKNAFMMMCYMPGFEKNKKIFFENTFPSKMDLFEKYFSNKQWLVGESLTYVDFLFCVLLDYIRTMEPSALDKYENVMSYVERFFKLEKIAAYRRSDRFRKFPINGRKANWGGNQE